MGHFDSFLTKTSGYPYYNISPYTMRTLLEDPFFFGELAQQYGWDAKMKIE